MSKGDIYIRHYLEIGSIAKRQPEYLIQAFHSNSVSRCYLPTLSTLPEPSYIFTIYLSISLSRIYHLLTCSLLGLSFCLCCLFAKLSSSKFALLPWGVLPSFLLVGGSFLKD